MEISIPYEFFVMLAAINACEGFEMALMKVVGAIFLYNVIGNVLRLSK